MILSTDRGNPLLSAYTLLRRSGFLRTSLGRRLFKSAYFLYKHYIEDDLQDLLQAFPTLVRGGDVLDIGANIGYTATVLARAADPDCKVYAFEPEPFNFMLLQRSAARTEFEGKIVPLQLAVGAAGGTINLWINDRHHADHRVITETFRSEHPSAKQITVPMVSIDNFLRKESRSISFVKIDVQGYELEVCQGMEETLQRNPKIIVVLEYMPSMMREMGFEPAHLLDFLRDRGFKTYQVGRGGRLSAGTPLISSDSGYCNLLFSRSEITCHREP